MSASGERAILPPRQIKGGSWVEWLTTTDHKRIGLLTFGTGLVFLFAMGALAMIMRTQLSQPDNSFLTPEQYNQIFTMHGSGMIALAITPLALGYGVYLVPLQVGSPVIAAPRVTLLGYWMYVAGGITLLYGAATPGGAADSWWSYLPLSDVRYTPGTGEDLWIIGMFLATGGMILLAGTILWTVLRLRAPGVTMLRLPLFTWAQVVTTLMTLAGFPSLLGGLCVLMASRVDPSFVGNFWSFAYQNLFWFYGHPVVYVMFFPFVGCVDEVLATFAGRRFFAYPAEVLALLGFSVGSMAVWGHHLFATGQSANDYFSLTSILLTIPAGIEYFGFLGTLLHARLRYPPAMLFALAFIPQFLIGGITGIMVAMPSLDYMFNDSFFVVGHFHYTLFGGSVFGLFAGIYFWFPKATGVRLNDRLGKIHFWLMVIGTNTAFMPMFFLGYFGMPRRIVTYPVSAGWGTLNLISTVGAFILGVSFLLFAYIVYHSVRHRTPQPPNPWGAYTLEWATSSPPPRFNFNAEYPVPKVRSYAPLLDLRERAREEEMESRA